MTRELSRKFHEAKARKRMESPAPDYDPVPDYDQIAKRITIESFGCDTKETHTFELFPCRGGRKDQYRANCDGKLWRAKISYSELFALLRKSR